MVGQYHHPPRDPDEGPVGLGLGQIGRGQAGLGVEAVTAEEEQIEVQRADGQVGERADQGVGRGADPAGQHHRVGRAVQASPSPAEHVRHPQRVGHDREPRHVEQALRQRERRGPGGQRDRGAGRDHARRRPGDRGLLRPLQHQLGFEARLMTQGRARQHRAAVHLLHEPVAGEHLKVSADRHIRDAEPLSQVTDPCAAVAPDGFQDERLAVSG